MDSSICEEVMRAVEALVFAADQRVQADQLARIIGEVALAPTLPDEDIAEAVARLNTLYEEQGRSFRIHFLSRWIQDGYDCGGSPIPQGVLPT